MEESAALEWVQEWIDEYERAAAWVKALLYIQYADMRAQKALLERTVCHER